MMVLTGCCHLSPTINIFSLNFYRLNWLPKNLPPGVKILISTLPDDNIGCLNLLTRILPPTNLIQISKMTLNTGEEILNNLLSKVQRTLTKEQRTLIIDSFKRCSSPLYMKVIYLFFFFSHLIFSL